ncbi:DUF3750 domain-containing protein [Oligoflexus sp.]|uniref:DUF3750 domain-containing protein n=1 Tax=Oligoflexus sp. TaxID=1971216 RepID=UPI0039C8E7FB
MYAARAYRWKGYFAVHTWIAIKDKHAASYVTYHVMGYGRGSTIMAREDIPDRRSGANSKRGPKAPHASKILGIQLIQTIDISG